MRIYVLAFGKLKTPGLRESADYYKRLSRSWVIIEEIELKPLSVPQKTPAIRLQIQEKEGKILLDRIGRQPLILLDELGQQNSSQQWAKNLRNWESQGLSSVTFCLGSSLGFSKEVRERALTSISLGPQTLPHELARVVLLEQIFRAHSILKGHPYHNEGL